MFLLRLIPARNSLPPRHATSRCCQRRHQKLGLIISVLCSLNLVGVSWGSEEFLITPVAVTSNSASSDLFASANLIDNSGLSPAPTLANYRSLQHEPASPSRAWATGAPRGVRDYFAGRTPDPVLTFILPERYQISHLVVWGFYYTSPNNSEASAFTLEFSSDGGETWTGLADVTHQNTARASETIPLGRRFHANAVRMTITDNHFAPTGIGGERVGLGEVKFIAQPPAGPDPTIVVRPLVDFGNTPTGEPIPSRSIDIENSGSQPLVIESPPSAHPFEIRGGPLEIAPGEVGSLFVSLPPIEGCHLSYLELSTNDPVRPTVLVSLLGAYNCTPNQPSQPDLLPREGTFVDPFEVTISSEDPGVIVYTTDGSLPTSENGTPYTGPVQVNSSTPIRARVIWGGTLSKPQTKSYVRLAGGLENYTSPLPIAIIENFGGGEIPNRGWSTNTQTSAGLQQLPRQPACLHLIDIDPESGTASITGVHDLTERIGIRVRGSFSSTWNPKPYSLETWDEYDADKNTTPLGLPGESDWIMYYPHPDYDRQLIANTFSWELSRLTGRYGTRYRLVDTFVNQDGGDLTPDDRIGVYAFAEKVTRDPSRIDFEPLSEDGSTGGWLLSINRMDPIPIGGFPAENGATSPQFFHTAGPDRILQTAPNQLNNDNDDDIPRQYNGFLNFENPNGYRINSAQRTAIETWFREFEDTLYDDTRWRDPEEGYRRHLDTRDFIDYFHLNVLAKQGDSLALSLFPWVSSRDRKLRIGPIWDYNLRAYWEDEATGDLFYQDDRLWYPRLFEDPDFLREYVDRWYELRRGPFSTSNLIRLVNKQSREFTSAMAVQQGITAQEWSAELAGMRNYLSIRATWIDSQFFRPPTFSHPGGPVSGRFYLVISNETGRSGTIFYTLDGSDPIDGTARRYSRPLSFAETAHVRSRVRSTNGEWSALNEASYVTGIPPIAGDLVLSEIMYNPTGDPEAEFIELLNTTTETALDLTLVRFTEGIDFTFPLGTILAPGERILVVRNRDAFEAVHGPQLRVAGEFNMESALSNRGERLTLMDSEGGIVLDFRYGDDPPWPEPADGDGYSLVLTDPSSNPDHSSYASWRSSRSIDGSPGTDDLNTFGGHPDEDRDGDGIPALLEFLLGSSDTRSDSLSNFFAAHPTPSGDTELRLTFSLANRDMESPVMEFSDDLQSWSNVASVPLVEEYLPEGRVRYRWTLPTPQPAIRFFRIKAIQSAP